jgi:hypothetical protein
VCVDGKAVACLSWRYKPLRRTDIGNAEERGWEGGDCIWRFKVEEGGIKVNPICDVISSSSSLCIIYSCANALDYLKLHNLRVREAFYADALFLLLASALV